jgi:hypothetical protein
MRLFSACPVLILCAPVGFAQVRLNQIQIIGSHNSYHSGLAPSEAALLQKRNPKSAAALEYRHPPLDVQFSNGVRQVELDIFADSKGGLYAHPAFVKMVADAGLPADPPFDPGGLFKKPGFKVMHAQDVDYRSNCQPFTQCLSVILKWSKAHPQHLPIFILIENKDGQRQAPYQVAPEEFTAAAFDALDKEILSVFPKNRIVTPDDVRGKHEILEQAVLTDGWPTLESARGKVVFLLDQRRSGPAYLTGDLYERGTRLARRRLRRGQRSAERPGSYSRPCPQRLSGADPDRQRSDSTSHRRCAPEGRRARQWSTNPEH